MIYQVSDPSQHIIGLTNGGIYYVHVVDTWTIQLANSYCEAVGHGYDSSCVGPGPSFTPISQNPIHVGRPSDTSVVHASDRRPSRTSLMGTPTRCTV